MKPYNWRAALANAGMVFIGCILARVPASWLNPAGSTETFMDLHSIEHALVVCFTITFFAELRYIYKFLAQYSNNSQ